MGFRCFMGDIEVLGNLSEGLVIQFGGPEYNTAFFGQFAAEPVHDLQHELVLKGAGRCDNRRSCGKMQFPALIFPGHVAVNGIPHHGGKIFGQFPDLQLAPFLPERDKDILYNFFSGGGTFQMVKCGGV